MNLPHISIRITILLIVGAALAGVILHTREHLHQKASQQMAEFAKAGFLAESLTP